jgi:hypothetical protein
VTERRPRDAHPRSLAGSPGSHVAADARSLMLANASREVIYASCWRTSRAWGASVASTRARTDPSARSTPPCRRSKPLRVAAWRASQPS